MGSRAEAHSSITCHARKQLYKLARTIDSWGNRIDSPGSGEMRVAKDNAPTVLDRNAKVSYELLFHS